MSRMASKAVIKRKLLILTLMALIIFVLVTQGCTCGCVATAWWPRIISDNSGGAILNISSVNPSDPDKLLHPSPTVYSKTFFKKWAPGTTGNEM